MTPALVFVHLGPSMPRWLVPSIRDHIARFSTEVVLISDNPRLLASVERVGATAHRHLESDLDRLVRRGATTDMHFRQGFWIESSRRFLALAAYQQDRGGPLIHVESDVVLLNSLDLDVFGRLGKPAAFPMISGDRAVGAVVYLEDPAVSSHLATTILEAQSVSASSNDMMLLQRFRTSRPELVSVLPTAPGPRSNLVRVNDQEFAGTISSGFVAFGGVFDAATIGQYLLGLDPRNHYGRKPVFSIPSDQALNPAAVAFESDGSSLWFRETSQPNPVLVHCLHVHSKDIRAFESSTRASLLQARCAELLTVRNTVMEFDPWGFRQAMSGLVRSRLARLRP